MNVDLATEQKIKMIHDQRDILLDEIDKFENDLISKLG
jgi:hypothetical protein